MNVNPANHGKPFDSAHLQFNSQAKSTGKMQGGHKANPLKQQGHATQGLFAPSLTSTKDQADAMKSRSFKMGPVGKENLGFAGDFFKAQGG